MSLDAFGRLRFSSPFTLFDYYPTSLTSVNLDQDYWATNASATGTNVQYASNNFIKFEISGPVSPVLENAKSITRISKLAMPYQAGISRMCMMTGTPIDNIGSNTFNVIMGLARVDTTQSDWSVEGTSIVDGIYFKATETTMYFVDNIQGTTSDANTVTQANWNIDVFDGNGPSGISLTISDIEHQLLIVFDQQYTGTIRCGFYISGKLYWAHQFDHDSLTYPNTTTPRLNFIYSLNVSSLASSPVYLSQMCCSCVSEGGFNARGRRVSINTGTSAITTGNEATTKYIVLAVRIKRSDPAPDTDPDPTVNPPTYPQASFKPLMATVTSSTNTNFLIHEIQKHCFTNSVGSVTSAPSGGFDKSVAGTDIEYYVGDGTAYVDTDGYILDTDSGTGKTSNQTIATDFDTYLHRITFTHWETLYLVCYGTGSIPVVGSVDIADLQ